MKSAFSWAELDDLSQGKPLHEQEHIMQTLIDRNNAQNIPTFKPKKNKKEVKKKKTPTVNEDALLNKAIKEAEQARKKIRNTKETDPKIPDPYE